MNRRDFVRRFAALVATLNATNQLGMLDALEVEVDALVRPGNDNVVQVAWEGEQAGRVTSISLNGKTMWEGSMPFYDSDDLRVKMLPHHQKAIAEVLRTGEDGTVLQTIQLRHPVTMISKTIHIDTEAFDDAV